MEQDQDNSSPSAIRSGRSSNAWLAMLKVFPDARIRSRKWKPFAPGGFCWTHPTRPLRSELKLAEVLRQRLNTAQQNHEAAFTAGMAELVAE